MAQMAAQLVEHVVPWVAIRQWVISMLIAADFKMDFPCHTGRSPSSSQTKIELDTGGKMR
jgi:hypothetical protein